MWKELQKSLPRVLKTVLICTDKGNISTGHLSKRYESIWTIHDPELKNEIIIAWQELPEPFIYSSGIQTDHFKTRELYQEDFSDDEIEIGENAFAKCHERIAKVIHEYLDKDEIQHDMRNTIFDAIKEFFEENVAEIIGKITSEVLDDFRIDININNGK